MKIWPLRTAGRVAVAALAILVLGAIWFTRKRSLPAVLCRRDAAARSAAILPAG
jgi:hypothetical protein